MSADVCPDCGTSLLGEEIPAQYRVHQSDHATHWRREIGHEVRGVYDGVLFWSCPDCGHAWPRFTDGGRLTAESARYANAFSQGGAA